MYAKPYCNDDDDDDDDNVDNTADDDKKAKTHNTTSTRALMSRLFDPQFANVVDYDCFSQVVFEDIEDYVRMKEDVFYLERARGDHENFADTRRSRYVFFCLGFFLFFSSLVGCGGEVDWREGLVGFGLGNCYVWYWQVRVWLMA